MPSPDPFSSPMPDLPTPPPDPRDRALPTEVRILLAAIDEVNELGPERVTVRGIAQRAKVNVAAINYYYRSKDRLLDRVIEQTLHNAFDDWIRLLGQHDRPLRDRFAAILEEMIVGARLYPGITRAHLHGPVFAGEDDSSFATWFRRLMHLMRDETLRDHPDANPDEIGGALVRLIGAFLLPPLFPDTYWDVLGGSLDDEAIRRRYVVRALDDYFGVVTRS